MKEKIKVSFASLTLLSFPAFLVYESYQVIGPMAFAALGITIAVFVGAWVLTGVLHD